MSYPDVVDATQRHVLPCIRFPDRLRATDSDVGGPSRAFPT